jgi:hypothetical protein
MISSKFSRLLTAAFAIAAGIALQAMPGVAEDKTAPAGAEQPAPADLPAATDPAAAAPSNADGSADAPASNDAGAAATSPDAEPSSNADTTNTEPSKTEGASDKASGDATAAPGTNDSADIPPVKPETPAATAEPAAPAPSADRTSSTVNASQLQIGAAVFGADGAKIGEINGVKSDHTGKVQEILVTDGVAAGLNAKVFAVSGDKITDVKDGVKLSLSSQEAKKLPIINNGNG